MISHTWALVFWLLVQHFQRKQHIYCPTNPFKKNQGDGRTGLLQGQYTVGAHTWLIISQHLIILSKWKVTNVSPLFIKIFFLGFWNQWDYQFYIYTLYFFCENNDWFVACGKMGVILILYCSFDCISFLICMS